MSDEILDRLSTDAPGESAPAPEQTVEPEVSSAGPTAQPSEAVDQEPAIPEEKKVPLAALHEERAKRRALEATQNDQADKFRVLEERLAKLQEMRDAPPEVTYEENPGEHLRQRMDRQDQELKEWREKASVQDQQTEQDRQRKQFEHAISVKEFEFKQTNADYDAAAEYLRDSRVQEYRIAGLSMEQATTEVELERLKLSYNAMSQDRNPAEAFYELAKARGYQAGNGTKDPAPPASPDLAQIQRNLEKTTSLGSAGASNQGKLTLSQLATMSDEEFAQATEGKRWADMWR